MDETEQEPVVKRGPGRPRTVNRGPNREPIRAEAGRIRTRMRKGGQAKDKFAIPSHLKQDGTSYEWKRASVYGKPDSGHMVEMREQGWEPVADRKIIDYFMPEGHKGAPERDGLILCERPQELTDEARQEEVDLARAAVRAKEQQLHEAPAGQFERLNKGNAMASVRHSVERGEIPVE